MSEKRRRFDRAFREGAVRIVREMGKADRSGRLLIEDQCGDVGPGLLFAQLGCSGLQQ